MAQHSSSFSSDWSCGAEGGLHVGEERRSDIKRKEEGRAGQHRGQQGHKIENWRQQRGNEGAKQKVEEKGE